MKTTMFYQVNYLTSIYEKQTHGSNTKKHFGYS